MTKTESLALFNQIKPDFFQKDYIRNRPDEKIFDEMLLKLADFDINKYKDEYLTADEGGKNKTVLGRFILAAMSQKSMVTNRIYKSGNRAAGYSIDIGEKGFRGIKDYARLLQEKEGD